MSDDEREVLVLRGHLDRAGRFRPRRCRSTHRVGAWPLVRDESVVAELLGEGGGVLHRELAEVTPEPDCRPGDAQRFRLTAYIELRPDAVAVRLRRDEILLWQTDIPPPAELDVQRLHKPSRRGGRISLALRYSEAGPGAHMLVVYRWGSGRFRVVYLGPPQPEIGIDAGGLPGGDECLLAVSYSNGLRSAHAATRSFAMPLQGPSLTIARPTGRQTVIAGTPLVLEGTVIDDEREGGAAEADLVWLIDDEEVGAGFIASVDGVAEGPHRVMARYRCEPGAEAAVGIRVVKPRLPTAAQWPEWDPMAGDFSR